MLLPSSSIDRADAILHAVHTQLVGTHTDHGAVLEMRRIGDRIIAFPVPLPGDPDVSKDRDRPVSRGNVAEWMEDQGLQNELVHDEDRHAASRKDGEWYGCHDFF